MLVLIIINIILLSFIIYYLANYYRKLLYLRRISAKSYWMRTDMETRYHIFIEKVFKIKINEYKYIHIPYSVLFNISYNELVSTIEKSRKIHLK